MTAENIGALLCTEDDNSCYRNVCKMSVVSFALAVVFIIGVRAGKFLGVRRIFARISPNLPEKILCDLCLQIFSHKDHEELILV